MSLKFEHLIMAAGLLHFCQVPAMIVAPKMLEWKKEMAMLTPINRRIVQVIGIAIMLTVLGMGLVVAWGAAEIAAATPLGLALAIFLTVFWAYRGTVQFVVYHRIWPGGFLGRASHYGLCLLFTFLTLVYGAAAIRPLMME